MTGRALVMRLIAAVRDGDLATVNEAFLRLSRSRRWLAPLGLAVGALAMLMEGAKLLFTNWRLTLIQVLPAMWIWLAMLDLKSHLLRGKSFHPPPYTGFLTAARPAFHRYSCPRHRRYLW